MIVWLFFFVTQKAAYDMRISDWSSDVCSADLGRLGAGTEGGTVRRVVPGERRRRAVGREAGLDDGLPLPDDKRRRELRHLQGRQPDHAALERRQGRSEEHTSELQSLMRISYDVLCLKQKTNSYYDLTYSSSTVTLQLRSR